MLDNLSGRPLVWMITLSCASCYLLFGYDQGVLGGLVTQPSFLDAIGNPSAAYLGTIIALYNIGCLVGCIIAALYGHYFGRKQAILYGCSIMIVGAIIQAATYGAPQLIVGRLISGVGNGINTSTIPMYVAETARANRRGRMVAVQLSVVIFGTVLAYWLDYGMIRNFTGEIVWRFPVAFQNVFAIITLATLAFLPDTPRWLFSAGRKDEAASVLARLMSLPITDPAVQEIMTGMEEAVNLEHLQKFDWKTLIYDKTKIKNGRRLVICFMIQFFQQFTGINVIAFYVTIVLEVNVGLDRETSSLVAGCIQIAFWLGTFPPMYTLDKFGRRPILLAGSVALLIAMVCFTVGIALNTAASSRLALAMLFLYEISFGMSWNAIPWIYCPEITPLELRHVGAAVGPFSEWLWTFVIVQMTPAAIENTGWRIYILFCVLMLIGIPFTYFFIPETAGKSLEEIDMIFVKGETLHMAADQEAGVSNVYGKTEGKGLNSAEHISLA